jgi:hypothetical protein
VVVNDTMPDWTRRLMFLACGLVLGALVGAAVVGGTQLSIWLAVGAVGATSLAFGLASACWGDLYGQVAAVAAVTTHAGCHVLLRGTRGARPSNNRWRGP